MLVLSRRPRETINIYPQEGAVKISIQILEVKGNQVRVGIEAPPGVDIVRDEIDGTPRKPKDTTQYVRIPVKELHQLRAVYEQLKSNNRALAVQGRRHGYYEHNGRCELCGQESGNPLHF
jgi:carbon storage regulator CsrA